LNRYSYALNNPVRFTDPTGHCLAALPFDTAGCVLSGPPGWVLLGGAAVVVVVVAAAGSNSAGATVESVGGAEGLPATSNSADTNDEIPTGPSGKLTRRDPGYWKRQGVDPEKLKDQVLHGSGSKYDVYRGCINKITKPNVLARSIMMASHLAHPSAVRRGGRDVSASIQGVYTKRITTTLC
jgi:hypothetical protein